MGQIQKGWGGKGLGVVLCGGVKIRDGNGEEGVVYNLTLSYVHKLATNGPNSHSSMICAGWGITPQFSVPALNPMSSQHSHLFSSSFSYFLYPRTHASQCRVHDPSSCHRMSHGVWKHGYLIHSCVINAFFHVFAASNLLKLIKLNCFKLGISSGCKVSHPQQRSLSPARLKCLDLNQCWPY